MSKSNEPQPTQPVAMTVEKIKADHPEIAQALIAEGAESERKRIQACEEAGLAGHEGIVNAMKYDGKSQAGDVAMAIVAAEKKLRTDHLGASRASAPQPVPLAAVPAVEKEAPAIDKSKPVDQWAKEAWESDASIRAEFGSLENYVAYEKAMATGSVKVHSRA